MIHINLLLRTCILLVLSLTLCAGTARAVTLQPDSDANRYVARALRVGIGSVNRMETYLSPLEYTGTEGRFLYESRRMTRMMGGRVSVRHAVEGNFSVAHNPTHDASYLSGDLDWQNAWHYNLSPARGLTLLLGAGTCLSVGAIYNTRNGNNPAQGKLSGDVDASAAASYSFSLFGIPLTARYQIDMPLLGLMFSPQYGQSYYEIFSLGHHKHNVCVTWPGNAPTFRNLLTLDVPIRRVGTIRLGWRADIRQSKVNDLKSHAWSSLFMLGYVRHFRIIKVRDEEYHKSNF